MSEQRSQDKRLEDTPIFTDPQERKRIRERAEALVTHIHEKNISNLILLDKSARPLTILLKETWARLYPTERGPHIMYMNIGQEVTQSDGIALLNRAIEELTASPDACARWAIRFQQRLEMLSSQEDFAEQANSARRAIELIQAAAESNDLDLKKQVGYRLGLTQNVLLFEALLRSLPDEEAMTCVYFTEINEAIRTYQSSLRRMHHAKTCIIDDYEHTGRTRIFSKWFVELLLRRAFPKEQASDYVESLAFSSLNHPIFNPRHKGDSGPPWQKQNTEVTDWPSNYHRPLHSQARWRQTREQSNFLQELDRDPGLDESRKGAIRQRLQRDEESFSGHAKIVSSTREELRQIALSQPAPSPKNSSTLARIASFLFDR